jgi:hypothetical protein
MHQILITTFSGGSSVHTTTAAFHSEDQAMAAAEIVNTETAIDQAGGVHRHATLLFVPRLRTEGASSTERGPNIPGVDREVVNRVIERFGQAVKSVEESRALEQVRSGFDRFIASAEQLMRRQPGAAAPVGDSASTETDKAHSSDQQAAPASGEQVAPKRIRYARAVGATDEQRQAANLSPLAAEGDMVLVWVNQADLAGHEEISPFST